MNKILHTRHWELYANDVKSITEPLFQEIGVNYFEHALVKKTGHYFNIATDVGPPEFAHRYFDTPIFGLSNFNIENTILFPTFNDFKKLGCGEEKALEGIKKFNLMYSMMIVKKTNNHVDLFFFSLDKKNAYEIYCNQQSLFVNFIYYYKEKARRIITHCSQSMNQHSTHACNNDEEFSKKTGNNIFSIRKYWLHDGNREVSFTKREYQVLECIAHGMQAKEAGQHLGCDYKTIEKHIENMKIKTEIFRTNDLIRVYWDNQL